MKHSIVIRPAADSDAEELLIYMDLLLGDSPNNLIMCPADPRFTTEDERAYIRSFRSPSCLLVATDNKIIAATIRMSLIEKQRVRHKATIGIAVRQEYRRQGIGERLMREAIQRARNAEISRLELQVFVRNNAAVALYRKLGFEIEGILRNSIKENDQFCDEYVMGLLL